MSTDQEWERWGARDPYFGVLTLPQFRSAALTAQDKDMFFVSGQHHVDYVMSACRRFAADFVPLDVLDFGCGVGRLIVPFAACAQRVVGMDISPSMLAEARRNCDERGTPQVELVGSDDQLLQAPGLFDLVHSCIVLQHLELARGRELFRELVAKVRPGGMGALHVTYGWDIHDASYGLPPPLPAPQALPPPMPWEPVKTQLRQWLRPAPAPAPPPQSPVATVDADPEMQMNYYNLSELMYLLNRAGVQQVWTDFTDHGGALGAFLFFRKPLPV